MDPHRCSWSGPQTLNERRAAVPRGPQSKPPLVGDSYPPPTPTPGGTGTCTQEQLGTPFYVPGVRAKVIAGWKEEIIFLFFWCLFWEFHLTLRTEGQEQQFEEVSEGGVVPPCQMKGKEKSPCLDACVPLRAALVHRVTLSRLHDALSLSILICKMRTVPALFL